MNFNSPQTTAWSITLLVMFSYGFIALDIISGNAGDPLIVAYVLSAILAVGVVGMLAARFRVARMFYVLLAMAAMQAVATVLALTLLSSSLGPTLLVNGLLIAGLLGAGVAFRKAASAKGQPTPPEEYRSEA